MKLGPDTSNLVLPAPWKVSIKPGRYCPEKETPIKLTGYCRSTDALLEQLKKTAPAFKLQMQPQGAPLITIGKPAKEVVDRAGQAIAQLLDSIIDERIKSQAYVIEIGEDGVAASSGGEPGLLYAVTTLSKLVSKGEAPCLSIQDRPALGFRAVLLDVSRGRVPTIESLKSLVDQLCGLKFNQLTFNIEHTFSCATHPEIGKGHDPLTRQVLADLVEYAHDRHIEVIPFQQSLGHLRQILSLPKYRHLAYDQELLWSLDPQKPETYDLLGDLYDAQIKATRSPFFHVGCDEPFDIIKKFDPGRFNGRSRGMVIRDHLVKVHQMLAERGRTAMAWADAMLAHPEIIPDLPGDLVLCHWLYGSGSLEGPEHYRPSLDIISRSKLPFYACTCSWSLMKLFPDLCVMEANHKGFIPEAKRAGAAGMMVTVWGDMGHMNLPGLELYPLAYASRYGWEDEPDKNSQFDAAFSWSIYGDSAGVPADLTRALDQVNRLLQGPAGMGGVGFLIFFAEPLSAAFLDGNDYHAIAGQLRGNIQKASSILADMESENMPLATSQLDHNLPVLQMEVLAQKLELIAYLMESWDADPQETAEVMETAAKRCDGTARLVAECLDLLEARWLASSKESDLEVNRERYNKLIEAWKARAGEFRSYREEMEKSGNLPQLSKVMSKSPAGYDFNVLSEMGLLGLL